MQVVACSCPGRRLLVHHHPEHITIAYFSILILQAVSLLAQSISRALRALAAHFL